MSQRVNNNREWTWNSATVKGNRIVKERNISHQRLLGPHHNNNDVVQRDFYIRPSGKKRARKARLIARVKSLLMCASKTHSFPQLSMVIQVETRAPRPARPAAVRLHSYNISEKRRAHKEAALQLALLSTIR